MSYEGDWDRYIEAEIPVPVGKLALQRMFRDDFFYLIGLGVLGFMLMFSDIFWQLDGVEVIDDLMGMTQTQFAWGICLLWIVGFCAVFWLKERHHVKTHIVDGVYQPEPKLKMTKGMLAKAIASAVFDKFSYLIWAFTLMPVHWLLDQFYFPEAIRMVVMVIVHLAWVIFIFLLLGRRKIKDSAYYQERQNRKRQKKQKKDKE